MKFVQTVQIGLEVCGSCTLYYKCKYDRHILMCSGSCSMPIIPPHCTYTFSHRLSMTYIDLQELKDDENQWSQRRGKYTHIEARLCSSIQDASHIE